VGSARIRWAMSVLIDTSRLRGVTLVISELTRIDSITRCQCTPILRSGQLTCSDGAAGTAVPAKSHPTNPLPSIAPHVTPPITAELFTAKLDGT
jgi:hypothetical protein